MPVAKLDVNVTLVRQPVAAQFAQWADLLIRPVEPDGWDHRTFHRGDHMTVRLPSAEGYAPQVEKEHEWLPKLAPLLPLPIPVPLAKGAPSRAYPWHWSSMAPLRSHESRKGHRSPAGDGRSLGGLRVEWSLTRPCTQPRVTRGLRYGSAARFSSERTAMLAASP